MMACGKLGKLRLAELVMREGSRRLPSFGTQCLTNSLWSVAKLGLRGPDVKAFGRECLLQIHSVMFKEMSPQGLANSLWACAKIQCDSREPVLDPEVSLRPSLAPLKASESIRKP